MTRVCNVCNVEKEKKYFNLNKEGKYKYKCCKSCYSLKRKDNAKTDCNEDKDRIKKYNAKYYEENKEKVKSKNKEWYDKNDRTKYRKEYWINNSDVLKEKQKKYKEENRELINQKKRDYWKNLSVEKKKEINEQNKIKYYENNWKEQKNKYITEKLNSNSFFKLKFNVRTLIRNSFKREFTKKSKKTIEILGCSFEEFKLHLESKFDHKMNWDNQGSYWHMDHIIPISSAKTEEDVYRLNHYTNFQPLYWLDNIRKGNKI